MTTRKQAAANKANAQKGSGPKTANGKAKSAQNAKKHGVTAQPDWDMVTRFYRIIVEDSAAHPDPFSQDPRAQAALALAEAQASLYRATQAERDYIFDWSDKALRKMGTLKERIMVLAEADFDDIDKIEFMLARTTDADVQRDLRFLKQISPQRPAARAKSLKSFARYQREATARRSKAIRQWVSAIHTNPETNPFSTKG